MKCKAFFIKLLFLLKLTYLHADSWTEPVAIDASHTFEAGTTISLCYKSDTNEMLAIWEKFGFRIPAYSIYKNGVWSQALNLSENTDLKLDIHSTYAENLGKVFATWVNMDNIPTYSIYTSQAGWTTPSPILIAGDLSLGHSHVCVCYNPELEKVFAVWEDMNNSYYPTCSIYSVNANWSSSEVIAEINATSQYLIYHPLLKKIMVIFLTLDNTLYCSSYDPIHGWSPAAVVASSVNTFGEIGLCYNNQTEKLFIAWIESSEAMNPVYSTYSPTTGWSTPQAIANISANAGGIALCYHSELQQVIATWRSNENSQPVYSAYGTNSSWSTPTLITEASSVMMQSMQLAYHPLEKAIFGTYPDFQTRALYTLYGSFLEPITNLTGSKQKNNFGLTCEYFNQLNWTRSISAATTGYHLYRNDTLIATLDQSAHCYKDHNREKKSVDTYTIKAFDNHGRESTGVSITIQ